MKSQFLLAAAAMIAAVQPALAQDEGGEIIVTASRSDGEFYSDERPVIGLRRLADSAVQTVRIVSDSRDEKLRLREIYAMLEATIASAPGAGVQLVTGDYELVPLTLANYKDIGIGNAGRPDTSQVSFLVKTKLAGPTDKAEDRIAKFVKSIPVSGRSLMEEMGDLTLTIVKPDQYRDQIVRLVARDSLKYAGYFGSDYGVEVGGLDQELAWAQVSATDVFLYIPYRFSIKPK